MITQLSPVALCVHLLFIPGTIRSKDFFSQEDNNILAFGHSKGSITIHHIKHINPPIKSFTTGPATSFYIYVYYILSSCSYRFCVGYAGHNAQIVALAFVPNRRLLAADTEGRIYVTSWEESIDFTELLTMPGGSSMPLQIVLNRSREEAIFYSSEEVLY